MNPSLRELSVRTASSILRCGGAAALCALLLAGLLCAQTTSQLPVGLWDGVIQGKAGEVTFNIDLQTNADGSLHATLINATDRQPFSSAAWTGGVLTLRMDYYDGVLTARPTSPQRMEGEYSRQTSQGIVHIPLVLVPHQEVAAGKPWTGASLWGDWLFRWSDGEGAEKTTLGKFDQEKVANADGHVAVTGVIEPVSGDTGLLHGSVLEGLDGKTHFHLSRFDGIHVMALDGVFESPSSLKGQEGGIRAISSFTAVCGKDVASAADPNRLSETLTTVKDPAEPFRFSGVNSAGQRLDQNSPEFKGKPLIIDIFGTWCPNCHDEAPVLEKLYQKYHDQGLQIVGLAYEYVDDPERDFRQIAIYREKFGITFPLLLAGTTDQGQIAKTLPQLVNFGAFPTSIYVDRSGHVKAILAGFTGPSTGEKFQQVQERMDELVREIVGPLATNPSQAPAPAFSLKVDVKPSAARTGSKFVIEVGLTNNTNEQIVTEICNGMNVICNFTVHVLDSHGNSVPEAKWELYGTKPIGIQPGQTLQFSTDLSKWFDLSRPDRYEIRVEKGDGKLLVQSNVSHIIVSAQ